ncbi:unnamed protein product, partial [Musa hybrid cultivar]
MEPVDLVPRGYRGTPFTVHAERYLFTDGSRVDRHRFLDSGQKARTSQQNRRQARDGGEVKEQPF